MPTPRSDGLTFHRRATNMNPRDMVGAVVNQPDVYTPGVVPYHGQYVGLPAMFYHPNGANGALYPTFMYSRDGANWHFDDPNHPIIDLSAHGQDQTTFGVACPATSLIEHDGQLWIYYSYSPEQHDSATPVSNQMCLAKLRADGFVGIQAAPGSPGTWTTSAITLSSDPGHLIVNAVVDGSLSVEVLDPTTLQPLAGYTTADALSLAPGDFLDALARWNGKDTLNGLAGQTVVLRFLMDDATIYSFHFESMPEPSAIVLLAVGLLGLLAHA